MRALTILALFSAIGQSKAEKPPKFAEAAPKFKSSSTYSDCLQAVKAGRSVILIVGDFPQPVETVAVYKVSTGELPNVTPGVYDCFVEQSKPVMRLRVQQPAKVVPKQVVGSDNHQCPNCGTFQFVQSRTMPDGSHTHVCPNCGTSWNHGGSLGYPGSRYQQPQQSTGFQFGLSFSRSSG